jgi:hypothetical protein
MGNDDIAYNLEVPNMMSCHVMMWLGLSHNLSKIATELIINEWLLYLFHYIVQNNTR